MSAYLGMALAAAAVLLGVGYVIGFRRGWRDGEEAGSAGDGQADDLFGIGCSELPPEAWHVLDLDPIVWLGRAGRSA